MPIIVDLKSKVGVLHPLRATVVSLIIMILFLFLGESMLNFIGIDISSFAIAGSIVIFFVAMEMVLGITLYRDNIPQTASIVPLAFPLIAGAGTITTILSLRAEYAQINITIAMPVCQFTLPV